MMLKGFSIYGLFGEYDYNINLSGSHITFLHSLNGYGKSTVMRLITDILQGKIEEAKSVNFKRMDLKFDDGTSLIFENEEDPPLIQMQKAELEEDISLTELKKLLNVLYISPDRSVLTSDGILVPALQTYVKELADKIKTAKTSNKLVSVPKAGRKEYNDSEMEFRSKDLKAKLDFMKRVGMEPDMPAGFRFPPTRYEIMERREEYKNLLASVEEYVNRYYELCESAIVYVDIVNDMLINKNVYLNENNILNVRMDNGSALPIERLSSGEKQILIMFYLLLFTANHGSLVIIDEPEISLHVAWQQRLGKTFSDIARLRDMHIIVATHSPQVIHDKWDLSVELKVENER